ncbi:hypothetical protein NFI96_031189, partial [Prochilodus magdalenae]
GRLKHGLFEAREKYPLVIPGQSHIATLLVRHFHDKVRHQGRAFTEGAVRTAGFWIVGAKKCIKRIHHSCVTCLKLRGRAVEQKMADLPADRLSMEPPFTNVGLDVFGPWTVITRRTRGRQANYKRGPAKQIHSDCGSNFTGACKELGMLLTDPEEPSV